jgi:UDP-N-acetylmuramoyl-tripeptide--D-alanyl-D-alanine ligase
MSILSLTFVAQTLNSTVCGQDSVLEGVKCDSRQIRPGDLFVALEGERVDGHDYLQEAEARGAVGALISRPVQTRLATIQVPDTLKALGVLARSYRQFFSIPMAAITGSCGKTTTKEMLSGILALQGSVLSNEGNLNTEVGVPLTLLRLLPEHRFAVVEMGARKKGDIAYLMTLAMPSVSLITNAGVAHIEIFGNKQGIAEAKGEIFQALAPHGTAVINIDDAHADYWLGLLQSGQKKMCFGFSEKADIQGLQLLMNSVGSQFELKTDIGSLNISLAVPGKHMVENALAAAAVARALDISLAYIKKGLEQFSPVKGRLQSKIGIGGVSIIDDSYNANPVSMRAALRVLANCPGQKIFVMGDMFELGGEALTLHREMGVEAKKLGVDQLLGLGTLTQAAVEGFGVGALHYENKNALISALHQNLSKETTVLVKGSRGMRMEEIVFALTTRSQEENPC